MPDRPAVPVALKRALYEEAGYRCAVPQCKGTSALEMAHIRPWSEVQSHAFENMIVLCAVDHTRYDRGEIPRQSIETFKANLAVLNGRYNDFEQRLLEHFRDIGPHQPVTLGFGAVTDLSLRNLMRDGIVSRTTPPQITTMEAPNGGMVIRLPMTLTGADDLPRVDTTGSRRIGGYDEYRLTAKGADLISRWYRAELIEEGD